MSNLTELLDTSPLIYALRRKVADYYRDEDNRKKFEDWYKAKYGKEYEWRKNP